MVITGLIKKQLIACEKTSGFDRKIHEHINESSYLVTLARISGISRIMPSRCPVSGTTATAS